MERTSFDDFKRELIERNDIVSIVSKYVPLERRGRYYWCRCPFHGEKTPSLCVNDIDKFFYCFGCHVGGNVINFVMQIETQTFPEAVKTLAGWANLEVPESFEHSGSGKNIEAEKKRKDRLISLMKDAARHYHENLNKLSAMHAKDYMKSRKISDGLAKHFGLGYSESYTALIFRLRDLGYTDEEMMAAGVAKKKEEKLYDPLANRIIFPIIDIYGNVIAFGGRTMDTGPNIAKYLNTAETELFNKRNTLYAINYLKKQRQTGPIPYVIVVEGYMDTIALHSAGFTMTVASMGTALTHSQAKMIKRFVDKVYICYDGDSAGQNATIRGLDILKEHELDVYVVQLPDRFDPDDVIKTYGKEGYQSILNKALPLTDFKLAFIQNKFDLTSVDGRVKYLYEAIDVLEFLPSNVERELYIPKVSEVASVNVDFIKRELEKKLKGKSIAGELENKLINVKKTEAKDNSDIDNIVSEVVIKAEKTVLCALIHKKPYAYFKTDATNLFTGKRREIYKIIDKYLKDNPNINIIDEIYNNCEPENQSVILEIINNDAKMVVDEFNETKYYNDCLKLIYKNYLENSKKELVSDYASEVDTLKKQEIRKQILDIEQKLKSNRVDNL